LSNGHHMLVCDDLNGSHIVGILNLDTPYTGVYNNGKAV